MKSICAVITGDIIGSTDLPVEDQSALPVRLRAAFEAKTSRIPGRNQFAISGGDGWQVYLEQPRFALRFAAAFRAEILSVMETETRAAIVLDTIDHLTDDLNTSTGSAFRRSGRALSVLSNDPEIKKSGVWAPGQQMICLIPETADAHTAGFAETLTVFADRLVSGWTRSQAQAISATIFPGMDGRESTLEELSIQWHPRPISKQAVGKHLSRSNAVLLASILARFEDLVVRITTDGGKNGS